jgi:hypothetical protein
MPILAEASGSIKARRLTERATRIRRAAAPERRQP